MGKVLSIIGGTAAILLGVLGLISWWWSFVELFKGMVPCFLIMGGVIAIFAGVSELKDELASKKEEPKKEESGK